MPRASRLDPAITSRLFTELRGGADISSACIAAGVKRRTVYYWIARGERGFEPYATFRALFERAEADGDVARLNAKIETIKKSGEPPI